MKTLRYIAVIGACALALGCAREQYSPDDWGREAVAGEGMRFGVDLTSTKSVFEDDTSLQLKWTGDETITVVSCPVAFLDVWGNESVAAGDFSAIHFGNFTVAPDETNPRIGTVLTKGAVSEWVGGDSGNSEDLYAFMAWTPASGLVPALGDENGFFTACEVPESQPDADYGKYQILYSSDLEMPTAEYTNPYVYSRGEVLGGAQVNLAGFVPATSMIRFRMKAPDEGEDYSISKIVIQSESGSPLTGKAGLQPDGTGVSAWSNFYPTQTDQNTSDVVMEFSSPITISAGSYGDWYHAVVIPCAATGKITFMAFDTSGKEVLYAEKSAPADGFEVGVRHVVELDMDTPPTTFFYVPSGEAVLPAETCSMDIIVSSYRLDLTTGEKTTLSFSYVGTYYDEECTQAPPLDAYRRYYLGGMVNGDDTSINIQPLGDGLVKVTVPIEDNLNEVVLASDYAGATATLRAMPEVGTESAPVNLAGSGNAIENTANTYIVNGPGWYKLPCVYGNAIKNGEPNTAAYAGLETWVSSPNISGAITSYVIWTDAFCPFDEDVTREQVVSYGAGGFSGINEDLSLSLSDGWISFHLPADHIDQGNLVIGVKDASGHTLWSWQVWVTVDVPGTGDVAVLNPTDSSNPYYLMGRPLGYTGPGMAKVKTIDGVMFSKWKQAETDKEFVFKIRQLGHSEPYYRRYSSSGTNYQWGRKDPHYTYGFSSEYSNAPKLVAGAAATGYRGAGFYYADRNE